MFDLSKLREIVGEFKNLKYEGGQKLVDEIRSTRYGKELWKYFVAAVLLLLIAEMLLARESKSESERISAKKFGRAT